MNRAQNRRRIGPFEFDPSTGELHRDGAVRTLRPQAAALLDALSTRPGSLVTRECLRNRLWPKGRPDSDLGLNVCMAQLRAALDDDAEEPMYVETLRGRGYRLIAEVGRVDVRRSGKRYGVWVAAGIVLVCAGGVMSALFLSSGRSGDPGPTRIAVLPYRLDVEADSLRYLRDGLSEDLITRLAGALPEQLAVIARTSSFSLFDRGLSPSEIADTLDADFIVQGSIRERGAGLRITTRVLDIERMTYIWSDIRDLPEGSPWAVDTEIAGPLLAALAVPYADGLEPEPGVTDRTVRDALLRARFLRAQFTREDSGRALELLGAALDEDADLAPLRIEMAAHHLVRGEIDEAESHLQRARGFRHSAVGLDHVAGRVALYGRGDVPGAVVALERAVLRQPGKAEVYHDLAQALVAAGRVEEAAARGERALALDPVSSTVRGDIGWVFYYARRYDEARDTCRSTLILRPESDSARSCIVLAAHGQGALAEEVETIGALLNSLGATPDRRNALLREVEAGNEAALWEWIEGFDARTGGLTAVDGARVLALLGRPAAAAVRLSESRTGGTTLLLAAHDPVFDRARLDPEFARALRRETSSTPTNR